jgi:hypothetical protein
MNTLYIQKNLFLWALSMCLIVTNTAWALDPSRSSEQHPGYHLFHVPGAFAV